MNNVSDLTISASPVEQSVMVGEKPAAPAIKVGLLCMQSPYDRNSFSGTFYHMHRALSNCADFAVTVIGERFHKQVLLQKTIEVIAKLHPEYGEWLRYKAFRIFMRHVESDLKRLQSDHDIDLIIAPVASEVIANLKNIGGLPPIFFITDATPGYMQEAYGRKVTQQQMQQEQQVINSSCKVIYSSHFMAKRAVSEYPQLRKLKKVEVIPFGINVDQFPAFDNDKPPLDTVELLFVGKHWKRKGGDIALQAANELDRRGVKCRLTIVGCSPPQAPCGNVEVIPYLNKNDAVHSSLFTKIQQRSHFLVLPTRADCTPMVIAEANAFGSPAIVSDVGGIRTLVEEGVNGCLLDVNADGVEFADTIFSILQEPSKYKTMAANSRRAFEQRLNWDAWVKQVRQLVREAGSA